MKIFNGTPHNINIIDYNEYKFNKDMRKYVLIDDECYKINKTFESNGVLNVKFKEITDFNTDLGCVEIIKHMEEIDPLSEGYDIYIVSALYYNGYISKFGFDNRLRTVSNPVFKSNGREVVGSMGIGYVEFK